MTNYKMLDNSRILCFSDLHAPYMHKDALKFLTAVSDKYMPTRVFNMGDETDGHAMSFYPTSIDLANATKELKLSRKYMRKVAELFPKVDCVESNHGSRLYRAGTQAGIPKELLVPYETLVGVQDYDWKWKPSFTITVPPTKKHITFIHNGGTNVFLTSQRYGHSVVAGHVHSKQGVTYWQSATGRAFGAQVGCLIDDNSPAYNYNVGQPLRPILGCLVILDGVPRSIEMNLTRSGTWDQKVN